MAKAIMIQGTMSNAGKSLLAAGLCRIFKQDGYRVAPFKSQNMALNSYITSEGLEMGRAQVVQAQAAGCEPSVDMNPILLKPSSDVGSQVIVRGVPIGTMPAKEYFKYKKQLIPEIKKAFQHLSEQYDIIVIEGAGSPAEINLKSDDIVNMGMARMAGAPVLLAGDIDRGGVFAQLYGTAALLTEAERKRIRAFVVNKFRGDKEILKPGLSMLYERIRIPFAGVIPYMDVDVDDEDSLSERLTEKHGTGPLLDRSGHAAFAKISVIRLPRISNFTDFNALERLPGIALSYVSRPEELTGSDLIILPGTKNTMGDLKWLRQNGLEAVITRMAGKGIPVIGVCGGFQMLGTSLSDPHGVEEGGTMRGMELLPIRTIFAEKKTRTRVNGTAAGFSNDGVPVKINGYEIHMGETVYCGEDGKRSTSCADDAMRNIKITKTVVSDSTGCVYGSYIHGLFDKGEIAGHMIQTLAREKGIILEGGVWEDYRIIKERQYDQLADTLREYLYMEDIYGMLREAHIS